MRMDIFTIVGFRIQHPIFSHGGLFILAPMNSLPELAAPRPAERGDQEEHRAKIHTAPRYRSSQCASLSAAVSDVGTRRLYKS